MSAARCLASASLLTRSAAGQAHRLLRPASLLPWIASPVSQQQRPAAAHRLRVLSTAAPWSEDKKINVYADYTIYKGKCAMSLKLIKPTWEQVASGMKISREGTVLLEFANALAAQQYNWTQKETFGLTALECAALLDAADDRRDCSFFHDPNKGGAGEGTIQKSLSVKPADKGSWFFTLNVSNAGNKSYISCNVTDAELRLIKVLITFLMPRMLGFDEHFAGHPSLVVTAADSSAGEGDRPPF